MTSLRDIRGRYKIKRNFVTRGAKEAPYTYFERIGFDWFVDLL
tara:strand:+ start:507 stop:635 length:129 start_codon:yes stop_codon:yes gene_type:complete